MWEKLTITFVLTMSIIRPIYQGININGGKVEKPPLDPEQWPNKAPKTLGPRLQTSSHYLHLPQEMSTHVRECKANLPYRVRPF